MNVMFSGGGTAGHINPAIAIAGTFRKKYPDCNIGFIGRENGSENELVKKAKIQLFTIPISGLSRSLTFKNFSKIKEAFTARKLAADILKDFRADVVIGTGGYVCWPVISAAADLEIPAVIHESNAAFGLTTKLLAKKCDLLLLGTDTKKTKYKNSIYTGNPVRADFAAVTRNQARQKLKIPDGKLLILSVGGSIGAKKLNDVCVETMKKYSAKHKSIYHIHSCGTRYYSEIQKTDGELCGKDKRCRIVPFIDDMATAICASDVIITRCGAMTLAEISYCATPAILVPSPNVTANHQYKNALYFSEKGAAYLLEESHLSFDTLKTRLEEILFSKNVAEAMRRKMREAAVVDASDKIVNIIQEKILTK